jgi:hypothetical protein
LKDSSSPSESIAQKRETHRIELGLGNVPIVEFPESVLGENCFFRAVDLSEGGLSFESTEKLLALQVGEPIPHCHLEFNAIDRAVLTLIVRHVKEEPQTDGNSLWRYGCSVEGLNAEDERLVRRTIQAQERKKAQSRSRFT